MAEVKTIKGISGNTWNQFKAMAAENKKSRGEFFEEVVSSYSKKEENNFWDELLVVKEPLTKYEAEELRKVTTKLRREPGFRK